MARVRDAGHELLLSACSGRCDCDCCDMRDLGDLAEASLTSVVRVLQASCLVDIASLTDHCWLRCCRSMPAAGRQGRQDIAARRRSGCRAAHKTTQRCAWRFIILFINCCDWMVVLASKVRMTSDRDHGADQSAVQSPAIQ